MAVRFNPPPGWQVPPGFRPDAGWVPDPAWPPAPQGWEYWVDDAARPARPETPAEATTVMAPVPAAVAYAPAAATTVAGMPPLPPSSTATYGAPVATLSAPPPPPPPAAIPAAAPQTHLDPEEDHGAVATVSAALRTVGDRIRTSSGRRAARRAADDAADASAARTRPGPRAKAKRGGPLIAGVAVACLALGCILGVSVSMMRNSDAAQALVDADRIEAAAEQAQADVDRARKELSTQRDDLQKREEALKEREKAADAAETDLASQKKAFEDQQAQDEADQQQQQQQQQQQDSAWFYWDCNAARQAGAAPIQNGQPAYRGALDPNGNGIACEEGE